MICYKDKERICDQECAAFIDLGGDGIKGIVSGGLSRPSCCLELNVSVELTRRLEAMECSNNVNSFYMRLMAKEVQKFGAQLGKVSQG